jgi:hypothetical protein
MTKETKLRIHNIIAKAALQFGSEAWVLKKRDEQRLEAAQMKFLRHLLGVTKLDRERNQSVGKKLGVQNIVLEIKQYQREWLQHVERMDTDRIPKQALKYRPKGREAWDAQGKDGRTGFTSRDKEQAIRLILHSS